MPCQPHSSLWVTLIQIMIGDWFSLCIKQPRTGQAVKEIFQERIVVVQIGFVGLFDMKPHCLLRIPHCFGENAACVPVCLECLFFQAASFKIIRQLAGYVKYGHEQHAYQLDLWLF